MFRYISLSLVSLMILLFSGSANAWHTYQTKAGSSYLTSICFSLGTNYKSSDSPTDWQKGLEKAVAQYNSVFSANSKVNFKVSPAGSSCYKASHQVYINFVNAGYNAGWYGNAKVPSSWSGKPTSTIPLNLDKISDMYDVNTKAGLIMHEMGHVLGLCHTYDYADCKSIAGTENDWNWFNSLYVDADYNTTFRQPVFTSMDKYALKKLYP